MSETSTIRRLCGQTTPSTIPNSNGVDHCGRTATVRQSRRETVRVGSLDGWKWTTEYHCEDHRLPILWVESTVVSHQGFDAELVSA